MTAPSVSQAAPVMFIRPEQALRAGRSDARNLLVLWCLRKSFYPLTFLGLIGAYTTGRTDTDIEWSDPGEVTQGLLSPLAGLILAVAVRIVANLASLALAYPLARDRDRTLAPRTGPTRGLSLWLDLRQSTRAHRGLRWTHHVRLEARHRVAPNPNLWWRLDQILDLAAVLLVVVLIVAVFISAA